MKYIKYVEKNTQLVNPQLDSVALIWSEEKGSTTFYKKYVPTTADATSIASLVADKDNLKTQDVEITDATAAATLTSADNDFNSLKIADTEINTSIILKAEEKITIENVTINGAKDAGNGKINYYTPALEISNVEIGAQATAYNVFEGAQVESGNYATQCVTASNITAHPSLTHNVINVYSPTNDAVITIKDSNFDLNVANSNILRMSNRMNADNVTIKFDNIHWTYENVESTEADYVWAGLMIFQPYSSDVAVNATPDVSHINTWKIIVKDCYYNGVKVTANNFGAHNQVVYTYNIGGTKACGDGANYFNIVFE